MIEPNTGGKPRPSPDKHLTLQDRARGGQHSAELQTRGARGRFTGQKPKNESKDRDAKQR